jgi:hypothetical protein
MPAYSQERRAAAAQPVELPEAVTPVLSVSATNTLLAPLKTFELMPTVCESTSSTPARLPQPVVGVSVTLFELTSMLLTRLNSKAFRRARKRLPRKT